MDGGDRSQTDSPFDPASHPTDFQKSKCVRFIDICMASEDSILTSQGDIMTSYGGIISSEGGMMHSEGGVTAHRGGMVSCRTWELHDQGLASAFGACKSLAPEGTIPIARCFSHRTPPPLDPRLEPARRHEI